MIAGTNRQSVLTESYDSHAILLLLWHLHTTDGETNILFPTKISFAHRDLISRSSHHHGENMNTASKIITKNL